MLRKCNNLVCQTYMLQYTFLMLSSNFVRLLLVFPLTSVGLPLVFHMTLVGVSASIIGRTFYFMAVVLSEVAHTSGRVARAISRAVWRAAGRPASATPSCNRFSIGLVRSFTGCYPVFDGAVLFLFPTLHIALAATSQRSRLILKLIWITPFQSINAKGIDCRRF